MPSFKSLLVANRGEVALRVMRTAKRMGLRTVAVYSDADRDAPHVRAADSAVHIGGAAPRPSYLNIESILRAPGDAVHPGYGFLAENPAFADAVQEAGRVWIGPPPAAMRALGDKTNAKALAARSGVPVLPAYDTDPEFPVVIKAVAGGGGRGMRLVRSREEFAEALKSARSEALHAFGDDRVMLEKAVLNPRHVEVQIFADAHGNCVHLGERDCSVQRRHQKLIEESPSPAVDAALRAKLGSAAVQLAKSVGYTGAGTIEFLLGEDGRFWFIEANARLQVEHPVTEAVTGLDLVEWQLRVAAGEPLPLGQHDIRFSGHAIEVRLCAEDPGKDFLPQAGRLALWQPSAAVRVEHALESGVAIPPHYDSMMAKLIAHAATRDAAREKLAAALDETVALGLPTNKEYLAAVLRDPTFAAGNATTDLVSGFRFEGARPDLGLAAALLVADYGEWTGWSNNAAHGARARFLHDEVLEFRAERAKHRAIHVLDGDTVHYAHGGASFTLRNTLYDPPARKDVDAMAGRLVAPMNGRVVTVNAKAGETVAKGTPLVVLEAMKMEHGLGLPFSVVVKAIHVAAGTQVAPNRLLVEFDPA
ncbi:MAG: biotin carboxylase N-terminal domain-containing protein [Burkholderiales bacterium]